MARMVKCIKLGREAEGLDFQTYPGELGKRIFENVSKEAWHQWIERKPAKPFRVSSRYLYAGCNRQFERVYLL